MTQLFTVQAHFDRDLIWYRGHSARYLLIQLLAEAATITERPPLNLALVIDSSGSMDGAPLAAAQQAALRVLQQLRPCDTLALVSFADTIGLSLPPTPCDDDHRPLLQQAIESIQAGGSTHLSGGWLQGAEWVAQEQQNRPEARHRVILLTDGHANAGITEPTELALLAGELWARGIGSSTVGIGDGYSTEQIQAIADAGGGTMHDAERPEEISEVVLGELNGLGQELLEAVTVSVTAPPAVRLTSLSPFPSQQLGQSLQSLCGSLRNGQPRSIALQCIMPAGTIGTHCTFEIEVTATDLATRERIQQSQTATLTYQHGSLNSSQPRVPQRALTIAQLWQAAIVREAVRLNRHNALAEAAHYVTQQLRHFERYVADLTGGERLLADLRATARSVSQPLAERSRKEINLALYQQQRGEVDYRRQIREPWQSFL